MPNGSLNYVTTYLNVYILIPTAILLYVLVFNHFCAYSMEQFKHIVIETLNVHIRITFEQTREHVFRCGGVRCTRTASLPGVAGKFIAASDNHCNSIFVYKRLRISSCVCYYMLILVSVIVLYMVSYETLSSQIALDVLLYEPFC